MIPLLVATSVGTKALAQYSPVMKYCISQLGAQACICINQLQNSGLSENSITQYCGQFVQAPVNYNPIPSNPNGMFGTNGMIPPFISF